MPLPVTALKALRYWAKQAGINLENLEVEHPFLDRIVPIIVGEHVTADAGTGLVHTAPAHGLDDYIIGQKYDLPIDLPSDE